MKRRIIGFRISQQLEDMLEKKLQETKKTKTQFFTELLIEKLIK